MINRYVINCYKRFFFYFRKDFVEEDNRLTLRLRCVASLYDVYYKAKEVEVSLRTNEKHGLGRINHKPTVTENKTG